MRLRPAITEEDAYVWLKEQAERDDSAGWTEDLETNLRAFAKAMAAISNAAVSDEIEPLFP